MWLLDLARYSNLMLQWECRDLHRNDTACLRCPGSWPVFNEKMQCYLGRATHPCPRPALPVDSSSDHMTRPSVQPVSVHLLGLGLNTIRMSISTLRGTDSTLEWDEFPSAAEFCALHLAQPWSFPHLSLQWFI
jgi:hypothetical protein